MNERKNESKHNYLIGNMLVVQDLLHHLARVDGVVPELRKALRVVLQSQLGEDGSLALGYAVNLRHQDRRVLEQVEN
jgi:hypothetical protein